MPSFHLPTLDIPRFTGPNALSYFFFRVSLLSQNTLHSSTRGSQTRPPRGFSLDVSKTENAITPTVARRVADEHRP